MESTGRVAEGAVAEGHAPLRLEPDVAQKRKQRAQQLSRAPTRRRGREVQDPCALQRLGQRSHARDLLVAHHLGVVVERPAVNGQGVKLAAHLG
jgi:hypothetical protein